MKKLLIGLTLLGATLSATAQTPSVVLNNCVLKQSPQTRVVEVSYELTGNMPVYVTLEITTNGIPLPNLERIRGDVSTAQFPVIVEPDNSAPKKIYWDARGDWPSNLTTEARATVTAWFTNDPPACVGTYVIVDLTAGPFASEYSVRYSMSPPNLSDPGCKTTELWLRRIPAGAFSMGSPSNELGRDPTRETQHPVTLTKDFYIGVFQVTQKQYERVMGTTPSGKAGNARPVEQVSYNMIRGTTLGAQWPADSQVDSTSFMGRLRDRTSLNFDLPTDAQWEYTCRAGTAAPLYSGEVLTSLTSCPNVEALARYMHNAGDGKGGYAEHTEVGLYLPNAWGLYDMYGNTWEWCLDWREDNLGTGAVIDPTGALSGSQRSLRGGSYKGEANYCRSAARVAVPPNTISDDIGFRACIQPTAQ